VSQIFLLLFIAVDEKIYIHKQDFHYSAQYVSCIRIAFRRTRFSADLNYLQAPMFYYTTMKNLISCPATTIRLRRPTTYIVYSHIGQAFSNSSVQSGTYHIFYPSAWCFFHSNYYFYYYYTYYILYFLSFFSKYIIFFCGPVG